MNYFWEDCYDNSPSWTQSDDYLFSKIAQIAEGVHALYYDVFDDAARYVCVNDGPRVEVNSLEQADKLVWFTMAGQTLLGKVKE